MMSDIKVPNVLSISLPMVVGFIRYSAKTAYAVFEAAQAVFLQINISETKLELFGINPLVE